MTIQQITVFLEDRPRALLELLALLARGGINIYALSMADTRDYGVLRLIVSDHAAALKVLDEAGIPVREISVLAAQVPDRPGGLAEVVAMLAERGVDIQYCYAFFTRPVATAWVIFRIADPAFAASVLARNGINVLDQGQLVGRGEPI